MPKAAIKAKVNEPKNVKRFEGNKKSAGGPKNLPAPQHGNPLERLGNNLQQEIRELVHLIENGKVEAAEVLYHTVVDAVTQLNLATDKHRSYFEPMAHRSICWPVVVSLHTEVLAATRRFLKDIGLAQKTGMNFSGGQKSFSLKTPANRVAWTLYDLANCLKSEINNDRGARLSEALFGDEWALRSWRIADEKAANEFLAPFRSWLEGAGKNLPPLSKGTSGQWAKAGNQLLPLRFGANFEEHEDLLPLRKSVIRRAKDYLGKTGARGQIRKEMRKAVKQAWGSIARVE